MALEYPPLLPTLSVLRSFTATEADNVIRTQMDAGPAKVRRRSTAAPLQWSMGHPAFSKAQLRAFLQFFREDAAHGAMPFQMADPVMGGMMTCRFAGAPSWSPITTDEFTVSVSLEILP